MHSIYFYRCEGSAYTASVTNRSSLSFEARKDFVKHWKMVSKLSSTKKVVFTHLPHDFVLSLFDRDDLISPDLVLCPCCLRKTAMPSDEIEGLWFYESIRHFKLPFGERVEAVYFSRLPEDSAVASSVLIPFCDWYPTGQIEGPLSDVFYPEAMY